MMEKVVATTDISDLVGQVEGVIYGTQNTAIELSHILISNYLENTQPTTREEMLLFAHNYKHIQTLVDAILRYECETQEHLGEIKKAIMELK